MQQSDMEAAQRINRYIFAEFYFRGWMQNRILRSVLRTIEKAQKSLHKSNIRTIIKTTDRTNVRINRTEIQEPLSAEWSTG